VSDATDIEWTDATWNPVRGCTKISPGCKHCYAETFAERFRGVAGHPYEQGFDLRLVPDRIEDPIRWRKPRRIFVNSMSDLFHEDVPDEYILRCFDVMRGAPQHTFQILTKRAERMRELAARLRFDDRDERRSPLLVLSDLGPQALQFMPWIWLGVSVEDRCYGLPRIEELQQAPAPLRFLSIEPLLEELGEIDLTGIGWVIVGGESGPGARPCAVEWIRSVVAQADAQRVPVFVKQLGGAPSVRGGLVKLRSRKGGDPAEWPEDLAERRAFPVPGGIS
jgi:protein gp37